MKSLIHQMTLIRFSAAGKRTDFHVRCNAVAANSKTAELLFASMAAPAHMARAIAAAIRSDRGFAFGGPTIGKATDFEDGYRVFISRLPAYSTAHIVAIADTPKVLIGEPDSQVLRLLQSRHITTPFLPEWVPQIRKRLNRKAKIRATNGFGCEVCFAEFETKDVDAIVSDLIRTKRVKV